jgi:hypothetical protein
VRALAKAGIQAIGIQPKGHGAWHVAEAVRETVRSERGKTEGIMGTLKTAQYGFNKPKERLWQTLEMAGPRAILAFTLHKLMRDLVRVDRCAAQAARQTEPHRQPPSSREGGQETPGYAHRNFATRSIYMTTP